MAKVREDGDRVRNVSRAIPSNVATVLGGVKISEVPNQVCPFTEMFWAILQDAVVIMLTVLDLNDLDALGIRIVRNEVSEEVKVVHQKVVGCSS